MLGVRIPPPLREALETPGPEERASQRAVVTTGPGVSTRSQPEVVTVVMPPAALPRLPYFAYLLTVAAESFMDLSKSFVDFSNSGK